MGSIRALGTRGGDGQGRARWRDLPLACPDCRGDLDLAARPPRCLACARSFHVSGDGINLLPSAFQAPETLDTGSKFQARLRDLSGWRNRLFSVLYVDPVRFRGDRQRTHGKNAHEKVLAFGSPSELTVLDLGSGNRRLLPHHVTADLAAGKEIDVQADAQRLPFRDGSWDRIIVQHVLEHVPAPNSVVHELVRVLRPGGEAYIEVPFLYPIHDRADFRRWSVLGLSQDVAPLEPIESGITMGPWSALGVVTRAALTHRIGNPYFSAGVDLLAGLLLLPLRTLDDILGLSPEAQIGAGAIYVIARRSA